jgi:hypothetical protein
VDWVAPERTDDLIHHRAGEYFRRLTVVGLSTLALLVGCGEKSPGGQADEQADEQTDQIEMRRGALIGPGLGNLTYAGNELFKMPGAIVDDPGAIGGHGNVAMGNGYLAISTSPPRWAIWSSAATIMATAALSWSTRPPPSCAESPGPLPGNFLEARGEPISCRQARQLYDRETGG